MRYSAKIAAALIAALLSFGSAAQPPAEAWRLVKKTWSIPGDALERYEYEYDAAGRITAMKNYRGKALNQTETDFVYDAQNRITSFRMVSKGADAYSYRFTYDDAGRLSSRQEVRHLETGKERVTLTQSYRYGPDKIIESKERPSFGGRLKDEITFALDANGNFTRKSSVDLNNNRAEDFIYGAYSGKPNPMRYTGAYFLTKPDSPQIGVEGHWQNSSPNETEFSVNADGLVTKSTVTYTTSDGGKVKHFYVYSYAKVK